MFLKKIKSIVIIVFLSFSIFLFFQQPVLADWSIGDQLQHFGQNSGFSNNRATDESSFVVAIGNAINIVLGFLGVIFVILIIYAGFMWMTAGGNESQVESARKIMIRATIGVIIILASYAITWFVMQAIESV